LIPTTDRRWTRGAWLTLAAAAGLLLGPVVATLIGLRYPTDGWTSFPVDSGAYELDAPVTLGPSPLRAGDLIVALDGQPLLLNHLLPLPADPQPGQVDLWLRPPVTADHRATYADGSGGEGGL